MRPNSVYESTQDVILYSTGTIVQKNSSLYLRTLVICLGSLFVGFALVYYITMRELYCDTFQNQKEKNDYCINGISDQYGATIPGSAILGSLVLCKYLQKVFSRRWTLIVNSLIGVLGSILILVSFITIKNGEIFILGWFIAGRILHGLVVGVYMTYCLVIINQYSPTEKKLFVIGIYQLSIQIGIIITNVFYPVIVEAINIQHSSDPHESWKNINIIVVCITILPLLFQSILLIFVFKSETPQYLIQQGKYEEAKSLITSLYKPDYALEKYLQLKDQHQVSQNSIYEDFDRNAIKYKALFLGTYAILAQQMSGVNFLNTIGLFKMDEDQTSPSLDIQNPYLKIVVEALPEICQFIGTLSLLVMSKIMCMKPLMCKSQRKALIQLGSGFSCVIMAVTLFIEVFHNVQNNDPHDVWYWLVIQCCFMLLFGFTLGIVCWLYVSQMLDSQQLRVVVGIHWMLALINTSAFKIIQDSSAHWIVPAILFSVCLLLSFLHRKYLIETKNKSKLEIIRIIDSFQILFCKKQ